MSKTVSKFALTASIVLAMAFTFSCTSDIESAEDVLKKAESSSSDVSLSSAGSSSSVSSLSSVGGSSSAVQGVSSGGSSQSVSVFCDFGDGDCREFSYEACLVFGQVVESCPGTAVSSSSSAPPSSGSLVPSSSSSSPSETVLCDFSGTCSPISADFCALLGGTPVQSCPESSSSAPPSSSSVPPSSSSVAPSSSSSEAESSSSVEPSSSSYGGLCAGFVEGTEREHYGKMKKQFCDERDGNKYVYVVIGTQTWMAENLNYAAEGSKCYSNLEANCVTYGRMYNWSTAMNKSASSTANPSGVQGVCPSGWHLPSVAESDVLVNNAGDLMAGKHLKAVSSYWNSYSGIENLDTYGFSALPGGDCKNNIFIDIGNYGSFWSATENKASDAYRRSMDYNVNNVYKWYSSKFDLYFVRCLQD